MLSRFLSPSRVQLQPCTSANPTTSTGTKKQKRGGRVTPSSSGVWTWTHLATTHSPVSIPHSSSPLLSHACSSSDSERAIAIRGRRRRELRAWRRKTTEQQLLLLACLRCAATNVGKVTKIFLCHL
jgi:hypothetical protein